MNAALSFTARLLGNLARNNGRLAQAIRVALIVLLGSIAAACAGPGAVHEHEVCGQKVIYHPDDLKVCRPGAAACTIRRGAAYSDIYYSTLDTSVVDHEEEHVCGMRHQEPWVPMGDKNCAVVLDGGRTQWKKGELMCRVDRGGIVKINDNRARAYAMAQMTPNERNYFVSATAVASAASGTAHVE